MTGDIAAFSELPSSLAVPQGDLAGEVVALARRWRKANGPTTALLTRFGGRLEDQLALLPAGLRGRVEELTARALETAWTLARQGERLPGSGPRGTLALALGAGMAGGAGGLPATFAELPFTITVLLHAIRQEAVKQGFDPNDPWIMAEALRTFTSGSPVAADDGINTAFFSARAALSGPALNRMITTIAPKLASVLGQKLATQTVPLLGALSGAALNAAFLRYYREMAAIRFRLLRLAQDHGAGPVLEEFARAVALPPLRPPARAKGQRPMS